MEGAPRWKDLGLEDLPEHSRPVPYTLHYRSAWLLEAHQPLARVIWAPYLRPCALHLSLRYFSRDLTDPSLREPEITRLEMHQEVVLNPNP